MFLYYLIIVSYSSSLPYFISYLRLFVLNHTAFSAHTFIIIPCFFYGICLSNLVIFSVCFSQPFHPAFKTHTFRPFHLTSQHMLANRFILLFSCCFSAVSSFFAAYAFQPFRLIVQLLLFNLNRAVLHHQNFIDCGRLRHDFRLRRLHCNRLRRFCLRCLIQSCGLLQICE